MVRCHAVIFDFFYNNLLLLNPLPKIVELSEQLNKCLHHGPMDRIICLAIRMKILLSNEFNLSNIIAGK